jgi:fatty-acyl-CoA synthase
VTTLQDVFLAWSRREPSEVVLSIDRRAGTEEATRAEMLRRVAAASATLRRAGVQPGDRVVLARPLSVDFAATFWAVQMLGAVAVPAPPPSGRAAGRAAQVIAAAAPCVVDCSPTSPDPVLPAKGRVLSIHADLDEEADCEVEGLALDAATVDPSSPAVIQFTSGSVLAPRGCVLSHAAITSNMRSVTSRFGIESGEVGVSWCPLFHDMGLFGSVVWPVDAGVRAVLQPPEDVVVRPASWLAVAARHKAAITVVPSFALALVARALRGRPFKGDLSNLREIIIGAERVEPDAVRRFLGLTEPAGLAPRAIHVAWGLAESTVLATSAPGGLRTACVDMAELERGRAVSGAGERDSREIASVGRPVDGTRVRIVAQGQEVPDGLVGEVELASNALLDGYYTADEQLVPAVDDGWLPTGDTGFTHDGDLFIVGRQKEIIIIGGRNVAPQDVESVVEREVPGVRMGSVAAFGVTHGGTEHLVLIVEAQASRAAEIVRAAREVCAQALDVVISDVEIVGRGALPRTSSGKLMRVSARRDYLARRVRSESSTGTQALSARTPRPRTADAR